MPQYDRKLFSAKTQEEAVYKCQQAGYQPDPNRGVFRVHGNYVGVSGIRPMQQQQQQYVQQDNTSMSRKRGTSPMDHIRKFL
jgi:hypothetical protein